MSLKVTMDCSEPWSVTTVLCENCSCSLSIFCLKLDRNFDSGVKLFCLYFGKCGEWDNNRKCGRHERKDLSRDDGGGVTERALWIGSVRKWGVWLKLAGSQLQSKQNLCNKEITIRAVKRGQFRVSLCDG